MATANLSNVAVVIDSSKESMKELRWALDSLRLRPDGALIVLHVQPPPGIAADLNPASIPFGSPQGVAEVSVFMQAIESHERRIPEAILEHALKIFSDKNVEVKTQVVVGDPKKKICEMTTELKVDLLVMGCRAFGPIKRHETV
ncbi:uncharacterized protein LOC123405122 [Hordeum vulgare subsp. vulgare]|uniref:uncharacterized protein LOC123405122 n=1 Tax=Hordeum vulgare subsp. vulgare TaxID=112509 RepID=UPI001D1A5371|nr:uncharacterized protein LOC123405122 [Hordeum vulgare subsp. vulgare]